MTAAAVFGISIRGLQSSMIGDAMDPRVQTDHAPEPKSPIAGNQSTFFNGCAVVAVCATCCKPSRQLMGKEDGK